MTLVRLLSLVFVLSGCSHLDSEDGCLSRGDVAFYDTDPDELALLVAWPSYPEEVPYLSLDQAGDHPGMRIDLVPLDRSDFTQFSCRTTETRAYTLETTPGAWHDYWRTARSEKAFKAGVGFPGMTERPDISEFGFAFVSNQDATARFSCGCLVN